jgi:hypothetical protein
LFELDAVCIVLWLLNARKVDQLAETYTQYRGSAALKLTSSRQSQTEESCIWYSVFKSLTCCNTGGRGSLQQQKGHVRTVSSTTQQKNTMSDHADLIAEFCSITDAAPDVADSFLAAHDYQLEGALNTFFHDPVLPAVAVAPAPLHRYDAPEAAGGCHTDLNCATSRPGAYNLLTPAFHTLLFLQARTMIM